MEKNFNIELDETLFQYDDLSRGVSKIAIKCNGNKVIILDNKSLSEITTIKTDFPIYQMGFSIQNNHYLYISYNEGKEYHIYDSNTGQEILRNKHLYEFFPASNMILYKDVDSTLRILTQNGNDVLGRIYDKLEIRGDATLLIKSQAGLYGLIDRNDGFELIPCKCTEYKKLNGNLIALKQNSKWAIVDLDNVTSQMSFLYDDVMEFTGDLIPVKMGDWGYIDRTSRRIVIPCSYKNVLPFNGEQAAVEQRKKWGVINTKNEKIIKSVYDFIQPIPGGLYITWKDEYSDTWFNDHFLVINSDGHTLYLVRKKDYKSNLPYVEFRDYYNTDKYGLININTGIVVPCVYDYVVNEVSRDCVRVKKYDKYGMCSIRKGKQVVPCKYAWVSDPNFAGLCEVHTLSGEKGVYDIFRGTELIPFDVGSGTHYWSHVLGGYPDESCDYIIKHSHSKSGLINRSGDIIIPCQCDNYLEINENLVAFKKYGKWGFFNAEGNPILENIHIENETIKKQNTVSKTEVNEVVVSAKEIPEQEINQLESEAKFPWGEKLWEPVKACLASSNVVLKAPKTSQNWIIFKLKSIDAQIVLAYNPGKNIATVQLETMGGDAVKSKLDAKIAKTATDHVIRIAEIEQSKRNKNKWVWAVRANIDKNDTQLVNWYADVMIDIYRAIEG